MNPDPTSLDRLHDIVAPPPAALWPPAPAWDWVIGFAALALVVALVRSFMHWQRNRYRRDALAELDRTRFRFDDPAGRAAAIAFLAELLKRAALAAWPRETVAGLTGPSWSDFLDRSAGRTKSFSGFGEQLEKISYDPRAANSFSEAQARELVSVTRNWIAHHRVDI
ncbi:MAG TPA: DUF4381 domain-containing protein [Chthoniobacterales bacterium]|jgi:hypothetical protein